LKKNKYNKEDLQNKILQLNSGYLYNFKDLINTKSLISIKCPDHGWFVQKVANHLSGQGCPRCRHIKCAHTKFLRLSSTFIERANIIHNNKYDYSLCKYVTAKSYVTIICRVHGSFLITPNNHLSGHGCNKCSNEYTGICSRKNKDVLIQEFKEVHNNKYDYSLVEYFSMNRKIKIICHKHGEFEQIPSNHLNGCGCPACSNKKSLNESAIYSLVLSEFSDAVTRYRPVFLDGKELDIFIPSKNIAIEYNGVAYHHSSKVNVPGFFIKTAKCVNYHIDKFNICRDNNILLIHVYDFQMKHIPDFKKILLSILHTNFNPIKPSFGVLYFVSPDSKLQYSRSRPDWFSLEVYLDSFSHNIFSPHLTSSANTNEPILS
jgi:hypothetical protein